MLRPLLCFLLLGAILGARAEEIESFGQAEGNSLQLEDFEEIRQYEEEPKEAEQPDVGVAEEQEQAIARLLPTDEQEPGRTLVEGGTPEQKRFFASWCKNPRECEEINRFKSFVGSSADDERNLVTWKKKHAALMETSHDAGKEDQGMKVFNGLSPCCEKKHHVTLIMAENRLTQPLWAASVGQKAAYAKKHGYSFYLSQTGRFVFDKTRIKVHDLVVKNALPVAKMAKKILAMPVSKTFPQKMIKQLQSAVSIPKTRKAMKGIGNAREATTNPKMPMYMKRALWWVLDGTDPPNTNWAQNWGVVEGTWAKVAATVEAMHAQPEGSWLWIVDSGTHKHMQPTILRHI
jgi:hypothetical protein